MQKKQLDCCILTLLYDHDSYYQQFKETFAILYLWSIQYSKLLSKQHLQLYINLRCREILIQLALGKICAPDRNAMKDFFLTSTGRQSKAASSMQLNSSITGKVNQLRFLSPFFPFNFSILLYLFLKQGVNYFLLVFENVPQVLVFRRSSQGGKER